MSHLLNLRASRLTSEQIHMPDVLQSGHSQSPAHTANRTMAKSEALLLEAENQDSLLEQLGRQRSEQVGDPRIDMGVNTPLGAVNLLARYFRQSYAGTYPVKVWEREKPDFHVQDAVGHFGLEMLFAMSGIEAENNSMIRDAGIRPPYPSPSTTERISTREIERMKGEQDEKGHVSIRRAGEFTVGGHKGFEVLAEQVGLRLGVRIRAVQKYDFEHPVHIVLGIESLEQDRAFYLDQVFVPTRVGITEILNHLSRHALDMMRIPGDVSVSKVVYTSGNTTLEVLDTGERFGSNELLPRLPVAEFIAKGYEDW